MAAKRKGCVSPFPTFGVFAGLRANAFRVYREGKPHHTFPDRTLWFQPHTALPAREGEGRLQDCSLCNWRFKDSTSSDSETSLTTNASILRTACRTVV